MSKKHLIRAYGLHRSGQQSEEKRESGADSKIKARA